MQENGIPGTTGFAGLRLSCALPRATPINPVASSSDLKSSSRKRQSGLSAAQQSQIEKIKSDLKESVLKTRELRSELTERATENVHAEAKIREVETELSVAQASTDLIATGVLDYRLAPDQGDEEHMPANEDATAGVTKTAT